MEFPVLTMNGMRTILMMIMRPNLLLALVCALSLLTSCTQTVSTPDIPFTEQLVVSCFLYGDSTNVTVDVSKTLPVNVSYNRDAALVKDAVVWLQTPSDRVRVMYDSVRKQYRAAVPAWVVGGAYTLSVEWRGTKTEGTTFLARGWRVFPGEQRRGVCVGGRTLCLYETRYGVLSRQTRV
jgi:hypothetical protein